MNKLFFLSLLDLTAAHAKQNRQIFSDLGLTDAQPKILYILIRGEGWLQKDLAEFCKISPASMTTLLNNMEKSDLIERRKTHLPNGKRAFRIFLTDKGLDLANKVNEETDRLEEMSLHGLTEEEREELLSLMERVTMNLS